MIELIIFYLHIVAASYAFTQRWQRQGFKEGVLAISLIALVFIIGWSLTAPIANLILPQSWRSQNFSSDTLGLLLLLIPELVFFWIFFLKDDAQHTVEN